MADTATVQLPYNKVTLDRVEMILNHAQRYINWDGWDIVLEDFTVAEIADLVINTRTDRGAIIKVMAAVRPLIPAETLREQEAKRKGQAVKVAKVLEDAEAVTVPMAERLASLAEQYAAMEQPEAEVEVEEPQDEALAEIEAMLDLVIEAEAEYQAEDGEATEPEGDEV